MRARRHVLVSTWFYDRQPGLLDFSYRIGALARHFDVTILSRRALPEPELQCPGAQAVVLPTAGASWRHLPGYWMAAARQVRRRRPHAVLHLGSQLAAIANADLGVPQALYWNEHPLHFFAGAEGAWLARPAREALRALTYRGARTAAQVWPIGEAHREDLLAHGVSAARAELMYMGVAESFRQVSPMRSVGTGPHVVTAIYAGSVAVDRGRDVMLEGLALANRDERRARLIIVGADEQQKGYCERRAAELGIASTLEVHGRVPGDQIPLFLRRAHFGVCLWADRPYWRFNPPTKLFEYLAAGLPVLASRIRTHTDYLRDGEDGLIFDYSAAGFAAALTDAWRSLDRHDRLSANARRTGARFMWSDIEPDFIAGMARLMRPA